MPNHTTQASRASTYIPGLDGLRALAVIAVFIYHLRTTWAPAGLLGVTMFFVLSGYLITGLLIKEWRSTHRIDFKTFWVKRFRRLIPAVIFCLLCVMALCVLFNPALLTKLRDDLVSSLFFFNNWWQIFNDVSYFQAAGSPSPVTHYWSLAVEAQFYLVWPVVLLVLFKLRTGKANIMRTIVLLTVLSALEMALLYNPDGDPSRVYYGTDTRAFSLLIGAWLAFAFPAAKVQSRKFVDWFGARTQLLGIASLAAIVAMVFLLDGMSPFLYYGGFFLLSVLTAVVMVAIMLPQGLIAAFFALPPMVWLGQRSYGIYLWHYPLLLLMNPANSTAETPWWGYLVQIAVILGAVEFSYRFIEEPFRRGALGKFINALREGRTSIPQLVQTHRLATGAATALCGVAFVGSLVIPPTQAISDTAIYENVEEVDPALAMAPVAQAEEADGADGTVAASAGVASDSTDPRDWNVLLVGDSVSLGAKAAYEELFPNGFIDSKVNRTVSQAIPILQSWLDNGWHGNALVIALGSNSVTTASQLEDLLEQVPDGIPVLMVNSRIPQARVETINTLLQETAARDKAITLVDWYNTSANHDEYFAGDGTHLTAAGADAYVNMILKALQKVQSKASK